jgi:hypothetical protein
VREPLKAYLWWLLGIASAVALAWAYHRRLTVQPAPPPPDKPEPPSEPPAPATRPRAPSSAGGSESPEV